MRMFQSEIAFALILFTGCTTLPEPQHAEYRFPKSSAFVGKPKRKYEVIGEVKARADYPTLDMQRDTEILCKNYFNKAVQDLVEEAKKVKADAVMDIRSVVMYLDGKAEIFAKPECYDDGEEGQILVRGTAIRWVPEKKKDDDST